MADMAMTIIELDGTSKEDFSILVGKSVILKFTQEPPLIERSRPLKKLITASLNLLQDTQKLEAIKELVSITGRIQKHLADSISRRDNMRDYINDPETSDEDKADLFDFSKRRQVVMRERIKIASDSIRKVEKDLGGLYVAQAHELYFCDNCSSYLGQVDEMLPNKCMACGTQTNPRPGKPGGSYRFLPDDVHAYLGGKWIQDYSAKLLRRAGWKTWTECWVMGASGVKHQIDLLAVHETQGRVLIAECKTRAVSEDAFQLITQFSDIQPSFGLLISLNGMGVCSGKDLIERKPGLKLIELLNKTDDEAKDVLEKYVSNDN